MSTNAWFLLIPIAYVVGYGIYSFVSETASPDTLRLRQLEYPGKSAFYRYNTGYLLAGMGILFFGGGALALGAILLVIGLIGTLAVDFVIDFQIAFSVYADFFSTNPELIALVPAGIIGAILYWVLE